MRQKQAREGKMLKQATVGALLLLACSWTLPAQAWEGKKDNKAVEDLERMTDRELCQETSEVCRRAAPPDSEVAMEGLEYLSTIRRAVQRDPGEALPPWFMEMSSAIAARELQRCPAAACSQLTEEGGERRAAPATGEPTSEDPLSGAPPEVP